MLPMTMRIVVKIMMIKTDQVFFWVQLWQQYKFCGVNLSSIEIASSYLHTYAFKQTTMKLQNDIVEPYIFNPSYPL